METIVVDGREVLKLSITFITLAILSFIAFLNAPRIDMKVLFFGIGAICASTSIENYLNMQYLKVIPHIRVERSSMRKCIRLQVTFTGDVDLSKVHIYKGTFILCSYYPFTKLLEKIIPLSPSVFIPESRLDALIRSEQERTFLDVLLCDIKAYGGYLTSNGKGFVYMPAISIVLKGRIFSKKVIVCFLPGWIELKVEPKSRKISLKDRGLNAEILLVGGSRLYLSLILREIDARLYRGITVEVLRLYSCGFKEVVSEKLLYTDKPGSYEVWWFPKKLTTDYIVVFGISSIRKLFNVIKPPVLENTYILGDSSFSRREKLSKHSYTSTLVESRYIVRLTAESLKGKMLKSETELSINWKF